MTSATLDERTQEQARQLDQTWSQVQQLGDSMQTAVQRADSAHEGVVPRCARRPVPRGADAGGGDPGAPDRGQLAGDE